MLQTAEISFIDIFGRNEFLCKQALSNSFYVTSLPAFWPYRGETNGFQTNAGHTLTANLACIFLHHFVFVRRNKRWVYCYYSKANYNENYRLMMRVLQTLTRIWKESRTMVLASPSASLTQGLQSDFKKCNALDF